MAQIRLKNVSKRWTNFVAVDNFNLDIADQEFLVLLGPSGCGKTTTMRMIAGLEDITEGEIWIGDRLVNKLEPKDRDISMVFQSYGLYPNMSVYENIRFPLKVRKVPQDQHHERVMAASKMVELDEFLQRRPAALSGGQRQRVALARAIVREPNAFLMDEPLSNLDAKLRVSTRAQIKNLHHTLKRTTIYVTHDQIEAMTMADQIVVMNRGQIEQTGSPNEVFQHPVNEFVMDFLGNVNLFHGRVEGGKAVFGSMIFDHSQGKAGDGPARLFVRPHELDVHLAPNGQPSLPATIGRILSAGPLVKIELLGPGGETINVDMSHDRFRTLAISVGDQVYVVPRDAKVFVEDYSI